MRTERPEYSVWQFYAHGSHEAVKRYAYPGPAVACAMTLIASLGAQRGRIIRVIITDGGDNICFEWCRGKGVTFPPQEAT